MRAGRHDRQASVGDVILVRMSCHIREAERVASLAGRQTRLDKPGGESVELVGRGEGRRPISL
jgi:hypothetical protein